MTPSPIELPVCPFCEIVAGRAPADIFHVWDDALAFVPLNPVTEGHLLVIPKVHVADVGHDPYVSAATMQRAAELAAEQWCNVITSRGRVATQSVFHLHFHIVPRREGDGLALPWTGQAQQWCKCPSCWGWFVEEHPGEDLDELGKDLRWWSGLPEHRDAPTTASHSHT